MDRFITGCAFKNAIHKAVRYAESLDYTWKDICGKRRDARLSMARFRCMGILHDAGISLNLIGYIMGGRDHSTVMHGVNKCKHRARVSKHEKEIKSAGASQNSGAGTNRPGDSGGDAGDNGAREMGSDSGRRVAAKST